MIKLLKTTVLALIIAGAFYVLPSNATHAATSTGCASLNGFQVILNGPTVIPEQVTLNAGEIITVTLVTPPLATFQDFSVVLTPTAGTPTTLIGTAAPGTYSAPVPFDFTGLVTLTGTFDALGISATCVVPAPTTVPTISASVGTTEVNIFVVQDANGNTALNVYDIDENGNGVYQFTISDEDLAPFIASPPTTNTLIKSGSNIALYALTSGEFQINAGPDAEGKTYVIIFDGLPPSNVYGYVIE